jgi:hypothetical protein
VGSTVVLRGAGFGDTQGVGQVFFTPSGGGVPREPTIANPGDWTSTGIATTVPAGASGATFITVRTNGVTSGAVLFTVTPAVTFNAAAVTWAAGPNLLSAVSGAGVAFAQLQSGGYVYAVGGAGAGGTPVKTVSYATVGPTGTIGPWTSATDLLVPLAFSAAVAATQSNSAMATDGFLYVLGGATDAAGTPVATVYRAPFNANGSVGAWTSITALPAPLRSIGAVVQYGSLYVVGGAASGNTPVATVYRSPIQPAGVNPPLTWTLQTTSLPAARARFGFGAFGLYLYVVGGESGTLAPNDTASGASRTSTVYFAKLNPSKGDVATSWTATTVLATARSAETAVFGAGNMLITGGLYTGASTPTSEESYAALNADGTTGSFATASPAASIFSRCGCNLFNHGATAYVGGDGSFHVLVVGGDNVNAPGTRRLETFIY